MDNTKKDVDALSKKFEGILLVNWNTGAMRIVKRAPKRKNPFEIKIDVKLKIIVPKDINIVAEGEVFISPVQASEMLIRSI